MLHKVKRKFFNEKIHEIVLSNKRLWDFINWIRKKTLLAIKTIIFEDWLCNTLPKLWYILHSLYNSAENRPINTGFFNKIPQADTLKWPSFSNQEFRNIIAKCFSFSTPGPNYISWRYLKLLIMDNTCLKKIMCITNTCINLEFWTSYFKTIITVVIPKPNKDFYNLPKSFQPIVLLNTTGKLIEKVISNYLQFHMMSNGFLDPNQLGGIRQCSTIDAGLYLTHLIYTGWLKQCHTSIIAFDIAQFFPSLNYTFLSACFQETGLNTNIRGFFWQLSLKLFNNIHIKWLLLFII